MEVQRVKMHENGSLFSIFADFTEIEWRKTGLNWMEKNWTVSLYGVAFYLSFIYLGQEYMRNRKPMELKRIMTVWNFVLAAFSICGTVSVVPEFVAIFTHTNGWHSSVCAPCTEISDSAVFWGWLFCMSKLAELGDTVFIVLRKKKLILLHWYHHVTVLLYCWCFYTDQISPARWFIVVNFFIHSLMYSYYTLRSVGVWVPRPIAMTITILQLSQMVVGVIVNGYAYYSKVTGLECDVTLHHLHLGLAMYFSYFLLFAHFFHKAYFGSRKLKAT